MWDALVLSQVLRLKEGEIRRIREAVSALRSWRLPGGRRTGRGR